jgi:hypothetical protein
VIFAAILLLATFYVLVFVATFKKTRSLLYMLPIITAAATYTFVTFMQEGGYPMNSDYLVDLPPISKRLGEFQYLSHLQVGQTIYMTLLPLGERRPRLVSFPYTKEMAEKAQKSRQRQKDGEPTDMTVHFSPDGEVWGVTITDHKDARGGQALPSKEDME